MKKIEDEVEIRMTGNDFDFTAPVTLDEAGQIISWLGKIREEKIKRALKVNPLPQQ